MPGPRQVRQAVRRSVVALLTAGLVVLGLPMGAGAAEEEPYQVTLTADVAWAAPSEVVTVTATIPGTTEGDVVVFQTGGGTSLFTLVGAEGRTSATWSISLDGPPAATVTITVTQVGGRSVVVEPLSIPVIDAVTGPGAVTISDPVQVGTPATVQVGTWSPSDAALTTAWFVDGAPVGTGATYTPTLEDLGGTLTVEVTGTHARLPGSSDVVHQDVGRVVQLVPLTTGTLTLAGTTDGGLGLLGQTLSLQDAGWTAGTVFTGTWSVGGVPVPGTTATSYTPVVADLGKTVEVVVRAAALGTTSVTRTFTVASVVTAPVVTVGSVQVGAGRSGDVVPVMVAGPAGAPVPTGDVTVTLVPDAGGAPTVLAPVALVVGSASVPLPALAAGAYTVTAAYTAGAGSQGVFLPTTGTAAVLAVTQVPTLITASAVTVLVATPGTIDAQVGRAAAGAGYQVRSGTEVLLTGTVPADGHLTLTLPVLAPGSHDLVLDIAQTPATAGVRATIAVTVLGEPVRSTGTSAGRVRISGAGSLVRGQERVLTATGFVPGETVAFYLHSDPVLLGTAVAGADGTAVLTATFPADAPVGSHTVVATGGASGRWAELAVVLAAAPLDPVVTVAAPAPAVVPAAAADPVLAATGAQAGGLVTGAWLLLVAGAGLVLVGRRVRAGR